MKKAVVVSFVFGWSTLVSGAVLLPMLWPLEEGDSFPLSTYPMFSRPLPTDTVTLGQVLGVDVSGKQTPLPPRLVGNGEVMQAEKLAAHAAHDVTLAVQLCDAVAQRVSHNVEFADVRRVQVAASEFRAVDYFERARTPTSRSVTAECHVPKRDRP